MLFCDVMLDAWCDAWCGPRFPVLLFTRHEPLSAIHCCQKRVRLTCVSTGRLLGRCTESSCCASFGCCCAEAVHGAHMNQTTWSHKNDIHACFGNCAINRDLVQFWDDESFVGVEACTPTHVSLAMSHCMVDTSACIHCFAMHVQLAVMVIQKHCTRLPFSCSTARCQHADVAFGNSGADRV